VADLRTTITEVMTGLGMCGSEDLDQALTTRPVALVNISSDVWERLRGAWRRGIDHDAFVAAWMNGRAFLAARDGLRGRVPLSVEWKGAHRAPGDEVVPADLRVDHVYLVSCKYLSSIVVNASPQHLFERLLAGGQGRRTGVDWFAEVAPMQHAALYEAVRAADGEMLPENAASLTLEQRRALSSRLRGAWPSSEAADRYQELVGRVAEESARRWSTALGRHAEVMLWRLLRIGSAPYFVLGATRSGFLRLRIATPWDWREQFALRQFDVQPRCGGQPVVAWRASARRRDGMDVFAEGHVEIRWSHGRFCGPPEAKVYLDTPHRNVPGYFPLE
jgi:hypothetical protein